MAQVLHRSLRTRRLGRLAVPASYRGPLDRPNRKRDPQLLGRVRKTKDKEESLSEAQANQAFVACVFSRVS